MKNKAARRREPQSDPRQAALDLLDPALDLLDLLDLGQLTICPWALRGHHLRRLDHLA